MSDDIYHLGHFLNIEVLGPGRVLSVYKERSDSQKGLLIVEYTSFKPKFGSFCSF